MTRRRLILATCLVIAFLVAAIWYRSISSEKDRDLFDVSLRLPIPAADTAFAPYYLAIDKGFFAKHGLRVKLEPGTPELNPVKMVAQGSDSFGVVGGPELLLSARAKGVPIVGIGLLHKNSDFVVVIAPKDSGISKLGDLRGKKVGFFYGHISTDVLRMLFRKEGIAVQEVDVGFDYGQLIARRIDAQWAFRTTAGISLPARGIELSFISPAEYGILTQGHTIITNDQMIVERPEIVGQFLAAILEATAYSIQHIPESIEATLKRDPNFLRAVGEKQMEIYKAAILRNSRIGWIAAEDVERTKEQMISVDLLTREFGVESAYTTRFLEQFYQTSR